MSRGLILLSTFTLLLISCSPTRLVAPLEKGEQRVGASLGGPLLQGAPFPIVPIGNLSYARGLGKDFSASSNLNVTALIFKSIYIDPTLHWASRKNIEGTKLPRLGLRTSLHSFLSLRDGAFAVYPEVTPYLFLENEKRAFYLGMENWLDFRADVISEETPKYWLYSVHSGIEWNKGRWHFQAELKYNGLNAPKNLEVLGLDGLGFGERGAWGLYFGLSYCLGVK